MVFSCERGIGLRIAGSKHGVMMNRVQVSQPAVAYLDDGSRETWLHDKKTFIKGEKLLSFFTAGLHAAWMFQPKGTVHNRGSKRIHSSRIAKRQTLQAVLAEQTLQCPPVLARCTGAAAQVSLVLGKQADEITPFKSEHCIILA